MIGCDIFYKVNGYLESDYDMAVDSEFVTRLLYLYHADEVNISHIRNCAIFHQAHSSPFDKMRDQFLGMTSISPLLKRYKENPYNLDVLPKDLINANFGMPSYTFDASMQEHYPERTIE